MGTPVYIYRGIDNRAWTAAPEAAITLCFGTIANLQSMFGGYATYGRLFFGTRSYGVYGQRNCARFRRLLMQSGLELQPVHSVPPQQMTLISLPGPRLLRHERERLERMLRTVWRAREDSEGGPTAHSPAG